MYMYEAKTAWCNASDTPGSKGLEIRNKKQIKNANNRSHGKVDVGGLEHGNLRSKSFECRRLS